MVSISIIIPIYNVEVYIRRCLESVMTQEFADALIECILVDDCTPDGSMTIVEEMVNMITGQRAYELNSKVIQTSDQMLQQTNNVR